MISYHPEMARDTVTGTGKVFSVVWPKMSKEMEGRVMEVAGVQEATKKLMGG